MSSYSPPAETAPHRQARATAGVEIRRAGKVYRGSKGQPVQAIGDVSLTIEQGEIVSLIGPSGCGKSTLLMLIAGLDAATTGEVLVNGHPVDGPGRDVGVVFQRDLLLDWRDVLGNVLSPFSMLGERTAPHRERASELLAQVGLAGFEKRRPYELSGGMRQRVALCRGLIQDPKVILLDEPFAALDSLTREQMQLDVQRLWAGRDKTAVLVTHDIAEAVFMSDRIVVMSSRPSRIHAVVDVDLPRPRTPEVRESKEFAACHAEVHRLFKDLGVLQ